MTYEDTAPYASTPACIIKPAVGTAKKMTGIFMGAETIDQHGTSFILVVPDVSVYDPGMSDSIISAGRLKEAGYYSRQSHC